MENKILISKIEKKLNKKVKINYLSIGFDVAEIHTGICLLQTDSEYLYIKELDKININKDLDIISKMEEFLKQIKNLAIKYNKYKSNKKVVVIEDSWLKKNPWTFKILCRFSTLVYTVFREIINYQYFMQAITARSRIGFKKIENDKKIKIQVKDYIKDKLELVFEDDDLLDGFVLALAGLIIKEEKKTKRRKK